MSGSTESQLNALKLEAISYKKLSDYAKAEKSILKGLELKPDSNSFTHELAKIHFKTKNIRDGWRSLYFEWVLRKLGYQLDLIVG